MVGEKSISGSELKRDDGAGPRAAPRSPDSGGRRFDVIYAFLTGLVLSQIEALLDQRAEARTEKLRPRIAASKRPHVSRRAKRAARA